MLKNTVNFFSTQTFIKILIPSHVQDYFRGSISEKLSTGIKLSLKVKLLWLLKTMINLIIGVEAFGVIES